MIDRKDDFVNFPFKYYPPSFGKKCTKIPTLLEFQKHVNKIELEKNAYIKATLKKKIKLAKINNYDIIICNRWTFKNKADIPMYQLICNNLIFNDSDMDEQFLLCSLRLLYICPMCFRHFQQNELIIILEKLIDLAINKEEPLCTPAIKCLQVIPYFLSKNERVIANFNKLFKVLVDRLLVMIDIPDGNSLVSIQNLSYTKIQTLNESIDIDELYETFDEAQFKKCAIELNFCTYIDICEISNSSSQKFHHMALLNCIIKYIEIDEIIENTNLMELINTCITRKGNECLALRCLALSIVCDNIKYEKFMIKLLERKVFERMFAIPYNFSSHDIVSTILNKIQTTLPLLDYINVKQPNLVVWMLRYAIKMYSVSDNQTIHYFLINLINRSQFYEIFNNMKGIKQILDEIKKRGWYISLTTETFDTTALNDFYKDHIKNVDFAVKFLIDHTLTFLRLITPSYITNSIPGDNISGASFEYINSIIKYYQNIGGIRHDVQFFDNILEKDSFYVIILLVRILCAFELYSPDRDKKKLKTLRDVVCLLKLLSLYHKSINAFTRFYDPYPGQLTKGNNLISFFKSLIELCNDCHFYFELLPFEIYTNLLMFLFPDSESYRSFMYSIDEKGPREHNMISFDDINIQVMYLVNLLQENSIIHHAIELLSKTNEKKACLVAKISAIKCLLLLTNVNKVMEIVCVLKHNIEEKINASLFAMINSDQQEDGSLLFFRYAFKLIEIININSQVSHSCTFNDFEENTYFDRCYIMSLISYLYSREFRIRDIEKMEKILLENNIKNLCNRKSDISFLSNIVRMILRSLSSYTKRFSISSPGKQKFVTKYYVNLMSHSFNDKIKYKKTISRNRWGLVYKNLEDTKTYNSIEKIDCFFSVKDNDNIVATDSCGIHCVTGNDSKYSHSSSKIYYIDTSPDGQLLICGGILNGHQTRFIDIWRYNQSDSLKYIKPCRNWTDLSWTKISEDKKYILGMNKTFTAKMFDIENGNLIRDFYNETAQSFARINSIEIDESGNVILFNGDLFCTRSGKLINKIARFSPHVSGIFMPSTFEVLINTELWDLRTFNLLERFKHLKDIMVKRTFNDNILFGESIRDDYHICYLGHHLYNWENFHPLLGDYVALYNSKDLSQLVKSKFYNNLMFATISNNCTKIATGLNDHDEYEEPSHTFRIMEIEN